MHNVLFSLLLVLTMAEQIGVQSGARVGVHNHSNISQGGVICQETRIVGAAVSIVNWDIRNTNNAGFVKVKEIVIYEASEGSLTVFFDLLRTAGAGAVNGRLYVNDVAVGVDHVSNPGPDTWSDVLVDDLVVGDRIQIYAHATGGNTATVENMILQYSNSLRAISTHRLVTALPTTWNTPILTVNNDP